MEWIKAKYDRLLLGIFGAIALLVGGLLIMKVLGFKSQFGTYTPPILRSDFGKGEGGKLVDAAKTRLAEPITFKPPVYEGKPISLFTSAPVIKVAPSQEVIPILDPKSKQVRPPIDNRWLYENGLNMERADIATFDSDGDGYSNTEEFLAKTNPRDKASNPGVFTKVEYKECVKDPLTLKINTTTDQNEVQFRRTEPADIAFNTTHLKQGDSFPAERGGTEPRFKILQIIAPKSPRNLIAILDDLLTKDKEEKYELEFRGKPLELPSRRAKLVCKLGKEEEKIVSEGEDFTFAAEPETKFTVKTITDEEVTLEVTPAGKTEKVLKTYKIPPPP